MEAARLQFDWKMYSAWQFHASHCLPGNGFLFYSCRMNPSNSYFSRNPILRWLPAFLMMVAIFLFSARPSDNLPPSLFGQILFKGGHVIGYGMLAMAYWRLFDFQDKKHWLVWLFAVLYAMTDEYHQSFVPGRHSTLFDVVVYDNAGALISLWLVGQFMKQKQPDSEGLVVEHTKRS